MKRLLFSLVVCLVAISCTCRASGQVPADYDALVHQGNAQLQASSNDLALATANSAIKAAPDRWEAYALAGGALMNLKRYEEAADDFSKAIDRAPEAKQQGLRDLRRQCFAAESDAAPPTATPGLAQQPAPAPAPSGTTTQAEIVLWKSIETSTNPDDFKTYMRQYPNGAFAALAQRHLAEAEEKAEQQRKLLDMPKPGNVHVNWPEVTIDTGVLVKKTQQFIPGLTMSNFRVFEDGIDQVLVGFKSIEGQSGAYQLVYRPINSKQDGSYRKIHVELVDNRGQPLRMQDEKHKLLTYEVISGDGYLAK
jgi:hypothetical protein